MTKGPNIWNWTGRGLLLASAQHKNKRSLMARLPRVVLPGYPLHVIQRGTNRCDIFRDHGDYMFFLACLQEGCETHGCDIHAYVLMTNHAHILLSPATEDGPSELMQFVGGRYAQYFNHRYERVGALWQGRYKATIVDTEAYFLVCAKYVELNPVRAGMVRQPADYRWSSHAHNALGRSDPLVRLHPLLDSVGSAAYLQMFDAPLDDKTLGTIRDCTNKGWALGDERFRDYVRARTRRRVAPLQTRRRRVDM